MQADFISQTFVIFWESAHGIWQADGDFEQMIYP